MVDLNALVADLVAEGDELDRLVAGLPESDWAELTPAEGWTIAHQIAHLAWTDRRALLSATDADAFAAELAAAAADPQGFVDLGTVEGAALAPAELLNRWRTGRDRLAAVLLELPTGVKFPWYGPPMSAASMATARLMETWAHGQDVYDAVGVHRQPSARLRHVAHLAIRTRDFAHLLHDRPVPATEFRVELTAPDGDLWTWGPADATDRVTGPALDFCLLAVQRIHRTDTALTVEGAAADAWLDLVQAFAGPPGPGRNPHQDGDHSSRFRDLWTTGQVTGSGHLAALSTDPENVTNDHQVLRVGNASGFYGDRFSAVEEMLTGGPLDVLTGDYLAELTMLILGRDRLKDPKLGYAKTFLRQLETGLGLALDRGVKIVSNAGGLNPAGLAEAIHELAGRLGLAPKVAYVEGDDLLGRTDELGLGSPLTANAYLGAWGIAEALRNGADVVVTGRVTDASVIVGPAAAHHGWARDDYDALAGAVAAGHVIECGCQATGGNFAFFTEVPDLGRPGFPIAEIAADGSSVITKHDGTGGAVTVDTVKAQLLYEITGARYPGPDVTTRIDTAVLGQDGPDRVRLSGVTGEPPPPSYKVSLNSVGGFRNEVTFVLTGLDLEAKADLVRRQLEPSAADVDWTLARLDRPDAETEEQASALLRCVVKDPDPKRIGRAFSNAAVELALASYPGFHLTAPPGDAAPYGVFTAGYVDAAVVPHTVVLPDGTRLPIEPAAKAVDLAEVEHPALPEPLPAGPTRRVALGAVAGARTGDKGGDANIGVWVRSEQAWRWLAHTLTVDELQRLLPEAAELPVRRHLLPNLWAVNFVVEGILGEGVASQHRFDPQAKALGEWLRSRHLDIPESLS